MDIEIIYAEIYAKKQIAKPITFVDKIKIDTISSVKQKLKNENEI